MMPRLHGRKVYSNRYNESRLAGSPLKQEHDMQKSHDQKQRTDYVQKVRQSQAKAQQLANQQQKKQDPVPILDEPIIPDWWPGEPEFAGLVPREDQEKDMKILVKPWLNGAPTDKQSDTFIFEWKKSNETLWEVGNTLKIPGPIEVGDPDIEVIFEMKFFQEHGTYNLRYRVVEWTGLGEALSLPADITIDKEAPHYNGQSPGKLEFDSGAVDGITEEYLRDNGDVLTLTVPVYNGESKGDTVKVYVGGVTNPVYEGPLSGLRTVQVPGAVLRTLQDGDLIVTYRLMDKVGNLGQPSEPADAPLLLKPRPSEPLANPVVELADDGIIDLADVRATTLLVAVPLYTNWLDIDLIVVTWGGIDTSVPRRLGPTPTDPIYIEIPFDTTLLPAYGDNTKGAKDTEVSYRVMRGSKSFLSGKINFDVDLSVPGPENPNRPDPVNPNLPALVVYGATDTAKARPNKLVAADSEQSVTVEIELYSPIGANENIKSYWAADDNLVDTHAPQLGDEGETHSFAIDWANIVAQPSGENVPVWYDIGLVAGGNREKRVTEVDVSAALPIVLSAPEFPDAGATTGTPPVPILNCNSYLPDDPENATDYYVRVTFPPSPGSLFVGDILDIEFQGYTDPDGNTPLPDTFSTTHTLNDEEVKTGVTINVTGYATYIEPIGRFGSVTVNYSKQGSTAKGSASIWASTTRTGGVCYILPTP
jgi:hypothetical protein